MVKRKNGFLKLKNIQIIKYCNSHDGESAAFWFWYQNKPYLFKRESEYKAYKEVFYSYVLNALQIPNVNYDFARVEDASGVITETYNPNRAPIMKMRDLLKKYEAFLSSQMDLRWQELYNVVDIKNAINWYFQNSNKEVLEKLKREITQKFIVQILFGDSDLNIRQTEFICENIIRLSPLYDFAYYADIGTRIYENNYLLQPSRMSQTISPRKTMDQFFQKATPEEQDLWCQLYMQKKNLTLAKIWKKIAQDKNFQLNMTYVTEITEQYKKSEQYTEDKLPKAIKNRVL